MPQVHSQSSYLHCTCLVDTMYSCVSGMEYTYFLEITYTLVNGEVYSLLSFSLFWIFSFHLRKILWYESYMTHISMTLNDSKNIVSEPTLLDQAQYSWSFTNLFFKAQWSCSSGFLVALPHWFIRSNHTRVSVCDSNWDAPHPHICHIFIVTNFLNKLESCVLSQLKDVKLHGGKEARLEIMGPA